MAEVLPPLAIRPWIKEEVAEAEFLVRIWIHHNGRGLALQNKQIIALVGITDPPLHTLGHDLLRRPFRQRMFRLRKQRADVRWYFLTRTIKSTLRWQRQGQQRERSELVKGKIGLQGKPA